MSVFFFQARIGRPVVCCCVSLSRLQGGLLRNNKTNKKATTRPLLHSMTTYCACIGISSRSSSRRISRSVTASAGLFVAGKSTCGPCQPTATCGDTKAYAQLCFPPTCASAYTIVQHDTRTCFRERPNGCCTKWEEGRNERCVRSKKTTTK